MNSITAFRIRIIVGLRLGLKVGDRFICFSFEAGHCSLWPKLPSSLVLTSLTRTLAVSAFMLDQLDVLAQFRISFGF